MDCGSLELPAEIEYSDIVDNSEMIMDCCRKLMGHLNDLPVKNQKIIKNILIDPYPDFKINPLIPEIGEILERGSEIKNRHLLFKSAPGAYSDSHNNFPGGLIVHTLTNIEIALSYMESMNTINPDIYINKDNVLTALFIHDLMKSWIMTWKDDFTSYPDIDVYGHRFHHLLITAQALHMGFESEMIKTLASIHYHPMMEKEKIIEAIELSGNLVSASRVSDIDQFLLEEWICYSAEHQSRDLSLYCSRIAVREIKSAVKRITGEQVEERILNHTKNLILSCMSDVEVFQYFKSGSMRAFDSTIEKILDQYLSG